MSEAQIDIIAPNEAISLYGLFLERLKRSPEHPAYRRFDAESSQWIDINWQQLADNVCRWQSALAQENLKPGERVALNLRNSVDWVSFDLAAMGLGLVVVPLYPDDRPDNVAYILEDAGVKLLLLQSASQWSKLATALTSGHSLARVVILNDESEVSDSRCISCSQWLGAAPSDTTLSERREDPGKLASIIYTSGTTGRPKGVMLSHLNMLSIAHASLQAFDIFPDDCFLSFLPLSHTLERTGGYYLPMMAGATVAFARSIPQLSEDIQTVKPTILIAVPRIFERIHDRLQSQLAEKPWIARQLFKLTVKIGWQRFLFQQGRGPKRLSFALWPLLEKRVASQVQQRMGGQLRLAVSGGAPLPIHAAKLFIGLGLELLQGYGLTETSPVISVNRPDANIPDSVGQPIVGVQVRIGEQDELQVLSPGNMLGYWNNHKATASTIDVDGWLHTGDQASINDTGHITITGRIKDILVLSNGEKVSPSDIESSIVSDKYFDQAMLIGEGQSFLSAIVVLNPDNWFGLARKLQLDPMSDASLNEKKLHQHLIGEIRQLMKAFPAYAKVRRLILTLDPWTIENGMLTPTMKVKRAQVSQHFEAQIRKLYS
ncbi:AMP-dependent synthetase/ligase [Methylophaga lonarensis]|nr:AMP-dependent synthetase/ligase [Methylophaga lonarensis]